MDENKVSFIDITDRMKTVLGVQSEKEPNKFQIMAKTHPQLYQYCIEKMKLGEVMDFIGIKYEKQIRVACFMVNIGEC